MSSDFHLFQSTWSLGTVPFAPLTIKIVLLFLFLPVSLLSLWGLFWANHVQWDFSSDFQQFRSLYSVFGDTSDRTTYKKNCPLISNSSSLLSLWGLLRVQPLTMRFVLWFPSLPVKLLSLCWLFHAHRKQCDLFSDFHLFQAPDSVFEKCCVCTKDD